MGICIRGLAASSFPKLVSMVVIVTFYVLSSTVTWAEPITLSGSITLVNGGIAGIRSEVSNLTGLNFSANVVAVNGNFGLVPCSTSLAGINGPCTGASLNWVTTGGDFSGVFELNGISYPANIINQLGFNFSSASFVVPVDLLSAAGVEILAPFTFPDWLQHRIRELHFLLVRELYDYYSCMGLLAVSPAYFLTTQPILLARGA